MLDFRPVGASEVARSHHSFDCLRSAFFFALPEVAEATASSFSESFDFFVSGISAAALSSSSMTIQPLEVERQRTRLIQSRRRMLLYIVRFANLLELRAKCRSMDDPISSPMASTSEFS